VKAAPRKPVTGDAFENMLYGSESDLADSDDDEHPTANPEPRLVEISYSHYRSKTICAQLSRSGMILQLVRVD
jgi:hypothetical protein